MTDQNQTITPQTALAMYASNWITPVAVSILASASEYLADPTLSEMLVQWATIRTEYENDRMKLMTEYLDGSGYWVADAETLTDRLHLLEYDADDASAYHQCLNHFIYRHHTDALPKE